MIFLSTEEDSEAWVQRPTRSKLPRLELSERSGNGLIN